MSQQTERRKRGRPRYQPSEKDRVRVESFAAVGCTEKEISTLLGITANTLRRYYRAELDTAHLIANATVARNLYKKATGSGPDAVNASKFWLSCRAGWQKTVRVEATGPDGGPIESKTTMTVNKFEEVARRVADEV